VKIHHRLAFAVTRPPDKIFDEAAGGQAYEFQNIADRKCGPGSAAGADIADLEVHAVVSRPSGADLRDRHGARRGIAIAGLLARPHAGRCDAAI